MLVLFQKSIRPKHEAWNKHRSHEEGMAMMIVLAASAIAALTTMAVAIRSHNSYINGVRQSLADRAKESAEAGLNILIESLNQDHPEWLIEPYDGKGSWSINRQTTGGCRTNIENNPTVEGTSNTFSNGTKGRYKLAKYSFHGNNFYGGVGSFEMEGEIRSSKNKLLASAKIYQDMSIIAKTCDALPGDTSNQDTIWPGIYANSKISDYNGAEAVIKGSNPKKAAEILCASDECVTASSSSWSSEFPPSPKAGAFEMPKAQEPPKGLKGIKNSIFASEVWKKTKKCKQFRIPEDLPPSAYTTDKDGTIHVYVSGTSSKAARLKGRPTGSTKTKCDSDTDDAIKISNSGPVRLYVDGSLIISDTTWIDTSDIRHAADFMILGTPKSKGSQKLEIAGRWPDGEVFKHFIWMPKAEIKFLRACQKTRLEGAIWVNSLKRAANDPCDDFQLELPEDMPRLIYQRLGKEFGIGQRDYVAQGVTSWHSYGRIAE